MHLLERLRNRHGRAVVSHQHEGLGGLGGDRPLLPPEPRRLQLPLPIRLPRRRGQSLRIGEHTPLGLEHAAKPRFELDEQPRHLLLPHLPKDLLEFGPRRFEFLDRPFLLPPRGPGVGLFKTLLGLSHPLFGSPQTLRRPAAPGHIVVAFGLRLLGSIRRRRLVSIGIGWLRLPASLLPGRAGFVGCIGRRRPLRILVEPFGKPLHVVPERPRLVCCRLLPLGQVAAGASRLRDTLDVSLLCDLLGDPPHEGLQLLRGVGGTLITRPRLEQFQEQAKLADRILLARTGLEELPLFEHRDDRSHAIPQLLFAGAIKRRPQRSGPPRVGRCQHIGQPQERPLELLVAFEQLGLAGGECRGV